MNDRTSARGGGGDERFTVALLDAVLKVLEEHGYRAPADAAARARAYGRALYALFDLVRAFEGRDEERAP